MKSLHFRSIAPKAPVLLPSPSPSVLPCHPPPAIPEATTNSRPKSIIVPSQNYALMQITGQEGTFSLVALPPTVSPPTPTQQSNSIQNNLKLPIPRYQRTRYKGTKNRLKSQKTTGTASVMRLNKSEISGGSPVVMKTSQDTYHMKEMVKTKEEPSEQLIFMNPVPSDISVTTHLRDSSVIYQASQLEEVPESAATNDPVQNLHSTSTALKPSSSKPAVRLCQSKQATAHPQSSITALTPAIFSKTVQVAPSTPKGKRPILPYSKVKNTLITATTLCNLPQEKPILPGLTSTFVASKILDTTFSNSQTLTSTLQSQAKTIPILKPINKTPAKKRGRKKKTIEDILAFEARKKRSLSFFRRRVSEKAPAVVPSSKLKEVDFSKKYRSIRPKPILVMERLPQLVSLPAITSESQEQDFILRHQLQSTTAFKALDSPTQQTPVTFDLQSGSHSRMFDSHLLHRCPNCSHCFQFKHHLQSHVNTHTNNRPHVCPVCRKAYAHSGSLSTHTKLHHSDVRPRRFLCCEFCEKSFGYVGVYFSHLREVHKVLLTVEPSVIHHEEVMPTDGANFSESNGQEREDPQELQIKCGRCQVVTPTFADMKMHLLHVHGEEVHIHYLESQHLRGNREPELELVKHAAHYWRQLKERRNLAKCGTCDAGFFTFSKLKKHIMSCHQERASSTLTGAGGGCFGVLAADAAFNCVLCSKVLNTKELVLEHWKTQHHCEQPGLLWEALSSSTGSKSSLADIDVKTERSEHNLPLTGCPDQLLSHNSQQILKVLV
ncbi:zinc finger protein 438 isoform X2 [Gouania willdenowi]|nr:zinc finger protein 438 isoform X2 [Gouania willdenowi]XP_028290424.1 zinc finger protein 438 isoform X2 [Gouania willdenowi]XP_028290425.1 zinc finger protein 438 isoform X2 [Gouania willdenowi]XP_028290426.1 zinc finger protein 438 isoform X2 [Gouania willdenowi]